jgi:hypothetical protein
MATTIVCLPTSVYSNNTDKTYSDDVVTDRQKMILTSKSLALQETLYRRE